MKILYYDCFSGISGDMNLGAMIDLGVSGQYLIDQLAKLNVSDEYELNIKKDNKNGIYGTKVEVMLKHCHHHHDDEHHHDHRNLKDIESIINISGLNENVKKISLQIFKKVAEAEAKVHNKSIDEVHFHEVGATDSIVDIVGAAICFDYLKVDKVMASTIEVGSGFVKCAHGVLPIPAPATAEILKNIPLRANIGFEATTPTGAAILSYAVDKFTDEKNFTIQKIGYGVGHKDSADVPNVLRVFIGEEATENEELEEELVKGDAYVLECNIDDMNPENYDYVMELLFKAGCLDVYLTPIIMKKERPAVKLNVLLKYEDLDRIKTIVLVNTSTLGVRTYRIDRSMLKRQFRKIETKYGDVTVKEAYYKGKRIKYKPEYDECKKIALSNNISIDQVYKEIISKVECS